MKWKALPIRGLFELTCMHTAGWNISNSLMIIEAFLCPKCKLPSKNL